MLSPLTRYETETVIVMNDEDSAASIHTYQRPMIRKLKDHREARLIREGMHGTNPWAQFEVPRDLVTIRKRRVMSDERKAETARRLAEGRKRSV